MPERMPVLFGASGFTGRLVAEAALEQGLPLVLAGRDRPRLEAVARSLPRPLPVRVADAGDPDSLAALAAEASVVLDTVGPFGTLGAPVVRACLAEGAHYLDTTGEQPWTARVHDTWDAEARSAGLVLCPSMAFEVAVADVAAALAARSLDSVHKVAVVYATRGFGTSRGTRASALTVLSEGGWQLQGGRRAPAPPGAGRALLDLPDLGRRHAVTFPSPEGVTIPRHLPVSEVTTWTVVPPALAAGARLAGPVLQGALEGAPGRRLGSWLARWGREPTPERRTQARAWVVVVAHGEVGGVPAARTLATAVTDPYRLTAALMVTGARRILSGAVAPGARAPAEVAGPGEPLFKDLGVAWRRIEGDVGV